MIFFWIVFFCDPIRDPIRDPVRSDPDFIDAALEAVIDRDQFHIRFFGLRLIRTCLQSQLPEDMSNRRNVVHSFKIKLTVNGTS